MIWVPSLLPNKKVCLCFHLFPSDICSCIIYVNNSKTNTMHPINCKRSNQIKRMQQFCENWVPFHCHNCFLLSGLWCMSTDLHESFSWGFVEKATICGCCWVHNPFLLTCKVGKHICCCSVSCSSSLPGQANLLSPQEAYTEHLYFHVHCLVHEF